MELRKTPWGSHFQICGFFFRQEVLKDLTKTLGCSKDELPSHTAALVKKCHEHVAAQHIASWRRCWMDGWLDTKDGVVKVEILKKKW